MYYSCVTKLRTWVPGPVYKLLTSAALRQATTWVDTESVKEWSAVKARREAFAKPQQFILKMREKADAARKRMQMPRSQAQPVSAKWPFRRRARPRPSSCAEGEQQQHDPRCCRGRDCAPRSGV